MDNNMAQIPYISHEARMYKAYQREMRLKALIIVTNGLWIVGAVLAFLLG